MGDGQARVIFAPRRRLGDKLANLRGHVADLQAQPDGVARGLRDVAAQLDELAEEK